MENKNTFLTSNLSYVLKIQGKLCHFLLKRSRRYLRQLINRSNESQANCLSLDGLNKLLLLPDRYGRILLELAEIKYLAFQLENFLLSRYRSAKIPNESLLSEMLLTKRSRIPPQASTSSSSSTAAATATAASSNLMTTMQSSYPPNNRQYPVYSNNNNNSKIPPTASSFSSLSSSSSTALSSNDIVMLTSSSDRRSDSEIKSFTVDNNKSNLATTNTTVSNDIKLNPMNGIPSSTASSSPSVHLQSQCSSTFLSNNNNNSSMLLTDTQKSCPSFLNSFSNPVYALTPTQVTENCFHKKNDIIISSSDGNSANIATTTTTSSTTPPPSSSSGSDSNELYRSLSNITTTPSSTIINLHHTSLLS
ncbi:unnamed protein product [Trichobilharzia regenti]|nr:unnamed protein product [Trichobilharzia regenti]